MKSIKIEDGIHEWLLDHRDSKKKSISEVIKTLIEAENQNAAHQPKIDSVHHQPKNRKNIW